MTLVILADQPRIQLIVLSVQAGVMGAYILAIRPQKSFLLIFMNFISEVLLVALHLFSFVFLDPELTEEESMGHGWIVMVLVGSYIVFNWSVVIYILTGNIRRSCKERREKKRRLKEKEIIDKKVLRSKASTFLQRKDKIQRKFDDRAEQHLIDDEKRTFLERNKKKEKGDGKESLMNYVGVNEYVPEQNEFHGLIANGQFADFYHPGAAASQPLDPSMPMMDPNMPMDFNAANMQMPPGNYSSPPMPPPNGANPYEIPQPEAEGPQIEVP